MCVCCMAVMIQVVWLFRPFTEDVLDWMPVDVYIGGIEHGT